MTLVWQRNQSPPCWLMWHKRWLSWRGGYLWLKFTELYYRIWFKKVGPSPSISGNLRDTKALTCAPANMLLHLQVTLLGPDFCKKKNFNWSIVDLQCCVNFFCIAKWFRYIIYEHAKSLQLCPTVCNQLFATLWTVAQQAPQFMGFSRQEY